MKRLFLATCLMLLTATGCIGVAAETTQIHDKPRHELVAVNNRVYLINTETGCAREIDLTRAEPMPARPEADAMAGDTDFAP